MLEMMTKRRSRSDWLEHWRLSCNEHKIKGGGWQNRSSHKCQKKKTQHGEVKERTETWIPFPGVSRGCSLD